MPKVTGPLFGTSAHGKVPGVGSFRRTPTGVVFQKEGPPAPPPTARQITMRNCMSEARRAWAVSPKYVRYIGGHAYWFYVTEWPTWWSNWRLDHPECSA